MSKVLRSMGVHLIYMKRSANRRTPHGGKLMVTLEAYPCPPTQSCLLFLLLKVGRGLGQSVALSLALCLKL